MDRQLNNRVPERKPSSFRTLKTVYNNLWRSFLQNIFLTFLAVLALYLKMAQF
jgi:hypothetical protein